ELAGIPLDVEQLRDRRRRRELPGDRPARVTADDPQAPLELVVVDLDDDAVDLEVERAAPLLPLQAALDDGVLVVQQDDVAVDREAALAQPRERVPLAAGVDALAGAVGPERQRARGGEPRIELADRARGRVARVHERRLAGLRTTLVERREVLERHV